MRPQGTELLTFEGEVALVIGTTARGVSPEQARAHIGWYAPANDVGLYDMRWSDRGSNVLSKGHDGFTPVGPRVPAADVDPAAISLRTLVNGEVEQDDSTANLLFPFGPLVADLSRFMTLEPGDIILTGTPAGSRPVEPGDVVEVELAASRRSATRSSRPMRRSPRSAPSRASRPRREQPRSASTRRGPELSQGARPRCAPSRPPR